MKAIKAIMRISTYAAVFGLSIWIGFFFGARSQQETHEEEAKFREALGNRQRVIAVVSLDDGVTSGGQTQNFASAIIETLGEKFMVTGNGFRNEFTDAYISKNPRPEYSQVLFE